MINFRYHLVSLVAVFLALGVGVIMGSAVIDRAVVDRLERQQSSLDRRIQSVRDDNSQLRDDLRAEQSRSKQLAEEGSQRLLDGTLTGVPVLVVGARGGKPSGLDDLVALLGRADARYLGSLWLTKRFALDDKGERSDLIAVLHASPQTPVSPLRAAGLDAIAHELRSSAAPGDGRPGPQTITALRDAGFVEFEAAPDAADQGFPDLPAATRIVVVSGREPSVADDVLALPLVRDLVTQRPSELAVPVLAVAPAPPQGDSADTFIAPIRDDESLAASLSTVDDLDDFAGRLAAVLAIADLGAGRRGHYGHGKGAQRLLPAPAP